MKFFSNLPKTTFTTTIGDFTIRDFFTYLDVNNLNLSTNTITVDNKSNLLGAAYQTYGDINYFWTFLAANEKINPFELLATNPYLFNTDTVENINLMLMPSPTAVTGGTAFPVGSIIVPATGNTGASYTMGWTGNFNINGAFAIVEETSYYDGNMVISEQIGNSGPFIVVGATSENVVVLKKNDDGSFTWAGSYYTANKKYYSDKIVEQNLDQDGKTIYKEATSANPTLDTYLPSPTPVAGPTSYTNISVKNKINTRKKTIEAYVLADLNKLQASFISAKYI